MSARQDFWSRRKAAVAAEAEAEQRANEAMQAAEEQALQEEKSDAEILEELDLKDPDLLEPGDDFSAFMKAAVPERLRRRALRKLWLTNPTLANVDGLVDYGEDFTDAATVVENLQTTYQVGKGMLKHILEMERQEAAKQSSEEDPVDAEETIEVAGTDETQQAEPQFADTPRPETPATQSAGTEAEDTDPAPTRRRMRFEFT
ncbi:uncharacterized protein DUF3306 [Aliiruegeria haliotis]|uniref:Uncharacterized protein DUF3306 n=1 Tax=Aliiruegeria haliotis TaxID=1280846 RepID=A0A2T0RPK1_9RHOB|nr:DUF3306 domain-containing protein [Aliiruegeria haliotis]PRY23081.1 uncharacterized protein DUF3306 [Aliiruegeria haliotis]